MEIFKIGRLSFIVGDELSSELRHRAELEKLQVTDQITEDVLDESFEGFVDEGLRGGW